MAAFKLNVLPHVRERITACEQAYKSANPHRYSDPDHYKKILNEFYRDESLRRIDLYQTVTKNEDNIKNCLTFMSKREHIINNMVDWGWTYDPRLAAEGLPPTMPWIPWQEQVDFMEWAYDHYLRQIPGIVEKSRDCGATWLMCWMYLQEWRWIPGFAGGIGSNKLENVDEKDNPDCVFEKLRAVLTNLPSWWFPKNWVSKKHNKFRNLINPEVKTNIAGQGGKDIGRGGRRTIYFIDEKASLEFPDMADAALSQTTRCQIDVSTPKGMNNFGQRRWSGDIDVFSFSWKNDFRKDEEWYKREKKRLRREVVAQEIDCDYYASVEGIMIRPEYVRAAIDLDLDPVGPCTAGLDIAAGGKNESALAIRRGPVARVQTWDIDNGVDLTHAVIDICNDTNVEFLHYDKPGVGYAVNSTIERTERKMKFMYYGWEPAGSPSDKFYPEYDQFAKNIFKNARAEAWYNIARLFENTYEHVNGIRKYEPHDLISIENDSQLVGELSGPKKIPTETGKIRVESKEQMLKRQIESPDRADALVLAFLPRDGGYKHVVEGYTPISVMHSEFDVGWGKGHRDKGIHYGAICLREDLSVNVACAVWNERKGHLYVYDELVDERPSFTTVDKLVRKMHLNEYELERMIGNHTMFSEGARSVAKELNTEFQRACGERQTIKVRQPRKYDPLGSMEILNQLVKKRLITIHTNCREINRQLSSWKLEKGKVKATGMREALLLIVCELQKVVPLKEIIKMFEYVSKDPGLPQPPKYEKILIEDDSEQITL